VTGEEGSSTLLSSCCCRGPKYRVLQLYHRRRDITFLYPQMEPQRRMLEDLGVDDMSSDEEVKGREGKQYLILALRWRAPALTFWLRIFDSLYLHHRNREEHGDQLCHGEGRVPLSKAPHEGSSLAFRSMPTRPSGWNSSSTSRTWSTLLPNSHPGTTPI